jgi:hypothetical protein
MDRRVCAESQITAAPENDTERIGKIILPDLLPVHSRLRRAGICFTQTRAE